MWEGFTWYAIYPGDIDEFERINGASDPDEEGWTAYMRELTEADVKQRLAEILSAGPANADWGGELYDLAADVRLSGQSKRAAFLLKGPGSGFSEMTPRTLGRNADQIFRLSKAVADILIVQHCHRVGDAVRETLRSFAVATLRSSLSLVVYIAGDSTVSLHVTADSFGFPAAPGLPTFRFREGLSPAKQREGCPARYFETDARKCLYRVVEHAMELLGREIEMETGWAVLETLDPFSGELLDVLHTGNTFLEEDRRTASAAL
jgi:hypothetical protein